MRIIFLALLAGPILFGCLTAEEPIANGDGIGIAGDSSGNSVPTIAGNPAGSTLYSEMYDFAPTVTDADGDTLTFSVQNKPHWAEFNSTNGRLRGQPSLSDIGDYNGIVISVSDGTSRDSLPTFSISVSQTANGFVALSWDAPTQNTDGSSLLDLAGYKIYVRKNSGSFNREIRINNPSITTYLIEQLSPATYHFVATAITSSGVESWYSAEVIASIQ